MKTDSETVCLISNLKVFRNFSRSCVWESCQMSRHVGPVCNPGAVLFIKSGPVSERWLMEGGACLSRTKCRPCGHGPSIPPVPGMLLKNNSAQLTNNDSTKGEVIKAPSQRREPQSSRCVGTWRPGPRSLWRIWRALSFWSKSVSAETEKGHINIHINK